MKTILLLVLLGTTGCSHPIPKIKATEIHSNTSVLGVASSVDATGIAVTGTKAKADDVMWKLSFPGFSHTTSAKGVEIPQPKEDGK